MQKIDKSATVKRTGQNLQCTVFTLGILVVRDLSLFLRFVSYTMIFSYSKTISFGTIYLRHLNSEKLSIVQKNISYNASYPN